MNRNQLLNTLDALLTPRKFHDYAPNGLQVEGCLSVKKIALGVTASLNFLQQAVAYQTDTILVHHGWFWKNEPIPLTGHRKTRMQLLLKHNINLLAYHLPLDAHPQVGNNVALARLLGIVLDINPIDEWLCWGTLPTPLSLPEFSNIIENTVQRKPLCIAAGSHPIKRVALCTGAGQRFIEQAYQGKADAFISGEISENTVHFSRENNIHYIAAGHHATERYGIQALGQWLEKICGVECVFIEDENPV